jgi:hypothetical protein
MTWDALSLPAALAGGWSAFKAANGAAWDIYLDARSGAPQLVQGQGIPLIPGSLPVPDNNDASQKLPPLFVLRLYLPPNSSAAPMKSRRSFLQSLLLILFG